jgi:putative glutamine amidotransferase
MIKEYTPILIPLSDTYDRSEGLSKIQIVNVPYIRKLASYKLFPLFISPDMPELAQEHLIRISRGLLIPGGDDVNPRSYGRDAHADTKPTSHERDMWEVNLYHTIKQSGRPILGICRGLQIINVAEGGTLTQDISKTYGDTVSHGQGEVRHYKFLPEYIHPISIASNTKLASILGDPLEPIEITSGHHNAIEVLGKNLHISAHSTDGLPEAIESTDDSFIFGTQGHPEVVNLLDPLWQAFANAALSS